MISIIVAVSKNGVIGKNNEIPWYLPDDLKHFAKITKGHTIIMGRKTYESIIKKLGHPLLDRKNIIITSQNNFSAPDCIVVNSTIEAQKDISDNEEVFIIGGAKVYEDFLPLANKLYLTDVDLTCEGDVSFPSYNKEDWREISREEHTKDSKNPYNFTFLEFIKNKRPKFLQVP